MDTEWIQRLAVAGVVLLATLSRRGSPTDDHRQAPQAAPETLTVYRVVRRSVLAVIVGVAC